MMIDVNDQVWCWGRNENGMLGNNSTRNSTIPVQLGLNGIKDIGAGCFQSMAIDENDDIWVWGENWNGQLGFANYNRTLSPTKSLINFKNQLKVNEEHRENMHEEAQAVFKESPVRFVSLATEVVSEADNGPEAKESDLQPLLKSRFSEFMKYNKKFLVSFALNILLVTLLLKRRKNK